MTSQKEMGEKIRKERKSKNLTMEILASMTGISYNTLGRIERGEYFAPMETYYRIGNILGIDFAISVEGEADEESFEPAYMIIEKYMPLLDKRYQEFAKKRIEEVFINILEIQSFNKK